MYIICGGNTTNWVGLKILKNSVLKLKFKDLSDSASCQRLFGYNNFLYIFYSNFQRDWCLIIR